MPLSLPTLVLLNHRSNFIGTSRKFRSDYFAGVTALFVSNPSSILMMILRCFIIYFQTLNTSFVKLKSDVDTMSQIMIRHTNSITNLTHQLTATQSYVANMERRLKGGKLQHVLYSQTSILNYK